MARIFYDDFTGSALGAHWTKRGTFTESVAGGNLTATFPSGAGLWLSPSTLGIAGMTAYEIELGVVSNTQNTSQVGPMVTDDTGAGIQSTFHTNPVGLLFLNMNGFIYTGGFGYANTTARQYPYRIRLRRDGSNWYSRHSFNDGVTWSLEGGPYARATTHTQIGFGSSDAGNGTVVISDFAVYVDQEPITEAPVVSAIAFNGGAFVSWSAIQYAGSYEVRVDGGTPVAVSGVNTPLKGLANGTPVLVEVRATNFFGPGPWGQVTVTPAPGALFDSFDRANVLPSTTALGTADSGQVWAQTGNLGITGGMTYLTSQAEAFAAVDVASNVRVHLKVGPTANSVGLIFRYRNSQNFWMLSAENAQFTVYRRHANAWVLQMTISRSRAAGDEIRVDAYGSTLHFFINDKRVTSMEDGYSLPTDIGVGIRHFQTADRVDWISARELTSVDYPNVANADLLDVDEIPASGSDTSTGWVYKGRDTKTQDTVGAT